MPLQQMSSHLLSVLEALATMATHIARPSPHFHRIRAARGGIARACALGHRVSANRVRFRARARGGRSRRGGRRSRLLLASSGFARRMRSAGGFPPFLRGFLLLFAATFQIAPHIAAKRHTAVRFRFSHVRNVANIHFMHFAQMRVNAGIAGQACATDLANVCEFS